MFSVLSLSQTVIRGRRGENVLPTSFPQIKGFVTVFTMMITGLGEKVTGFLYGKVRTKNRGRTPGFCFNSCH